MSAIAPITIDDGQTTPVAHIYNPIMTLPPTYVRNGDSSVPVVAQEKLVSSLKQGANTSDAINRAKMTLLIPVLETPSGGSSSGYVAPPKVAYYLQANVEFLLPNRSTEVQRKDLRVLTSNALLNSQIVSLVDKLESSY